MNPPTRTPAIDHRGIAVAIGRELNHARLDLGWTRATGASRAGIALSTLDSNETGIRRCSLFTLIKLCWSMAIAPPNLIELAMQRMLIDLDTISLRVDLRLVATDPTPPQPVRQWAVALLENGQHRHGVVCLPPPTVVAIARALEIKLATLIGYFGRRAPYSVRGSATDPGRTAPSPLCPDIALTKEVLAQALGIELRNIRAEHRWTQRDVAERLPVPLDAHTWYSYERGEVLSTIARLIELGQLFSTAAPILLARTLHRLGPSRPDPACITGGANPHTAEVEP